MDLGLIVAVGIALYIMAQTSGSETNADGTGTDAGWIDEAEVALNLVPDFVNAWADRITQHEGWHPGSRSYRNNNPGNLEIAGDLGRDSGGYGIFSSYNAGRNALVADLTAKVRKYATWSLYQVMERYAPPNENDTQAYANTVAGALGVSTTIRVGDIAGVWAQGGRAWVPVAFSQPAQPAAVTSDLGAADASLTFDELINGTLDPGADV